VAVKKPRKIAQLVSINSIPKKLPARFLQFLKEDRQLREMWETPDPFGDRSVHDWMLGRSCVEKGITDQEELAVILMKNPHGKYRRDGRIGYVEISVANILKQFKQARSLKSSPNQEIY